MPPAMTSTPHHGNSLAAPLTPSVPFAHTDGRHVNWNASVQDVTSAPKGLFVNFLELYTESCANMGQAPNVIIVEAIKVAFSSDVHQIHGRDEQPLIKIDARRRASNDTALEDEDVLPLCLCLQEFRLKSGKSTQRPNLSLDLSGHNLTSKAVEDFGSILQVAKNLKILILAENQIDNGNMLAFGVAVYGSQLECLDLTQNKITDDGLKQFFQGMLNSASVCQEVHTGLSDLASSRAPNSVHHCRLRELHVGRNQIAGAGCQALIALLEENIDDGQQSMPMLADLRVVSVHVCDPVGQKIRFAEEVESALGFVADSRGIQIWNDASNPGQQPKMIESRTMERNTAKIDMTASVAS